MKYLIDNNYTILCNNFRTFKEEIDIICRYDDILVFIEVKSRYNSDFGIPCQSVTYSKQRKIIKTSIYYINQNNLYDYNVRYDVIELFFNNINNNFTINHIEDAFRIS